jgi:hypothetical protein
MTQPEMTKLRTLKQQRDAMLIKPLQVHQWPLFECTVVKFNTSQLLREVEDNNVPSSFNLEASLSHKEKWRVQVKLSLVLLDALSEITLRRELELLYEDLVLYTHICVYIPSSSFLSYKSTTDFSTMLIQHITTLSHTH